MLLGDEILFTIVKIIVLKDRIRKLGRKENPKQPGLLRLRKWEPYLLVNSPIDKTPFCDLPVSMPRMKNEAPTENSVGSGSNKYKAMSEHPQYLRQTSGYCH